MSMGALFLAFLFHPQRHFERYMFSKMTKTLYRRWYRAAAHQTLHSN